MGGALHDGGRAVMRERATSSRERRKMTPELVSFFAVRRLSRSSAALVTSACPPRQARSGASRSGTGARWFSATRIGKCRHVNLNVVLSIARSCADFALS